MFHAPPEAPWLLLLHQVPARPSSLRVKVWRRLQGAGALPLRNAAYLLPNRPEPREDLAWIASEVRSLGGQASLLAAAALDEGGDAALVAEFRAARAAEYRALAKRAERLRAAAARPGAAGSPATHRERLGLQREWERLARITFFDTPEQEEARRMIERVQHGSRKAAGGAAPAAPEPVLAFRGKTWVTRPRPGIDRMSSAWFIRTHVDPKARFAFATEAPARSAVPFDMYAGEFSHTGDACTLEVLVRRFGVRDPAVEWLCRVVHDVDLRDDRYREPEAAGVAALVEGLRARCPDDRELLEQGISFIAAMVRGRAARAAAPAGRGRSRRPRPAGRRSPPRRAGEAPSPRRLGRKAGTRKP